MPGAGDTASFAAGTLTTIANHNVTDYIQSGGMLLGISALTVNGSAVGSGGVMTGTGITLLGGATSLTGDKDLTNGRVLTLAGATSWAGNTAANSNVILFAGGTLNNSGSFFDGNAFNTLVQNFSGSNAFNNSGSYSKLGNSTTTIGVAFNDTGTTTVNAGALHLQSAFNNLGLVDVRADATFEVSNAGFSNSGTVQGDGQVRTAVTGALLNIWGAGLGRAAAGRPADAGRRPDDGRCRCVGRESGQRRRL